MSEKNAIKKINDFLSIIYFNSSKGRVCFGIDTYKVLGDKWVVLANDSLWERLN